MMTRVLTYVFTTATVVLALTSTSSATWSIVIADADTKEVAVGTVTCLNNFDLMALVPVLVVGKGGGAVQSAGDFDGIRRPIIFDGLMNGASPAAIFEILEGIPGHQQRQYGIVDTKSDAITFSGASNGDWAGGVTGSQCSMYYAIQGNVLTGPCVVAAIEEAVLNTAGDIAAKLMAGMQAARSQGGDGRCSCNPAGPTDCGCPPPAFIKSGHIGGMAVARIGDADDPKCNADGCVDGDYFMRFNVPFQSNSDPDPVIQLQEQFDAWRADLVGRPDAVQSSAGLDPPSIPHDDMSTTTLTITLLDWQSAPITAPIEMLTIKHAPESAGISTIGEVVDHRDGTYSVTITAGPTTGVDRFLITADDGIRPVILMPNATLEYCDKGQCTLDCNGNGIVDSCDIGNGTSADCNANDNPDECDLLKGSSIDCNKNAVPDECEPDCNENDVADECDITDGTSDDVDGNGIPDECHGIVFVPSEFSTIQAGIDVAKPGDTVLLADGIYTGPGNKDLDFFGKSILVKSAGGPANCIIDCQNEGRGFIFQSGETRDATVQGITITHGQAIRGAAIFCVKTADQPIVASNPTIKHCVLLSNNAEDNGGAIYSNGCNPLITRCAIIGNTAGGFFGGGGIYALGIPDNSGPDIDNSLIVGNSAENGAGIFAFASTFTLRHSTLSGNMANPKDGQGAGIFAIIVGQPLISNSILWGNTAAEGAEIYISSADVTLTVEYSNVQGGQEAIAGAGKVIWGPGNIGEDSDLHDPQFIDPLDPSNDYHLFSDSPCIDAGDPGFVPALGEVDLDGHDRVTAGGPKGQAVTDMGSYEFQFCPADLTGDGQTNAADLALLLGAWGPNPGHPADLNNDGEINAADLALLLGGWGVCG